MLANGNEFVPRAGTVFNYGPYNHLQRPDEKFSVGTFAHYTVNEHFEPYTELMFTSNETDAQIAFTGTFFNTDFLACDHPFLSEQQRNVIIFDTAVINLRAVPPTKIIFHIYQPSLIDGFAGGYQSHQLDRGPPTLGQLHDMVKVLRFWVKEFLHP